MYWVPTKSFVTVLASGAVSKVRSAVEDMAAESRSVSFAPLATVTLAQQQEVMDYQLFPEVILVAA